MFTSKLFIAFGLLAIASTVFGQGWGGNMGGNTNFGGGFGGFGGFGGGRGRGGGHGGHGMGRCMSNLTDTQRQELRTLKEQNENATKQVAQNGLQSFFQNIGGDALTCFNQMQTEMETRKAQFANFTANANISDAARNLLNQMEAIKGDMTITKAQEHEQIKALFDGASDEVKQELKSFGHGGGRHGGRGGFGGFGGNMGGFGGQQGGFGGFGGQGFGGRQGFGGQQGGFGGQGFGNQGFGGQQGGFGGQGFGGQQGGFGGQGFGNQGGFGGQGFGGQQGGFGGWGPRSSTPVAPIAQ